MELPFKVGISPTLNIRGLIATRAIKKWEVLERCPIVMVDHRDDSAFERTILNRYCYEWTKSHSALVLGYGSLYNHSYAPNVYYVFNHRTKEIVFRALRRIEPGEELFMNYNGDPEDDSPIEDHYLDGKH
ncbi:MAG: SET domain-containing protein [Anaerolineae bacterium]